MNGVAKLLDAGGYIQVNKTLIKELGLHEAILIGELCSEYNYWEFNNKLVDDMFYSTRENIETNTGLNDHYQRKAFATLTEKGIVTIVKKGLPATNYYKIDFYKLLMLLSTSPSSGGGLEVKSVDINKNITNKNNKQNSLFISNDINKSQNSDKSVEEFVDLYHKICVSLPKVSKLSDKRIKGIRKIINKFSYDDILTVLNNIQKSDFCKGKNDRGWKADIDFILREDKFISALEGKYNNTQRRNVFSEVDGMSMSTERKVNGNYTKF